MQARRVGIWTDVTKKPGGPNLPVLSYSVVVSALGLVVPAFYACCAATVSESLAAGQSPKLPDGPDAPNVIMMDKSISRIISVSLVNANGICVARIHY